MRIHWGWVVVGAVAGAVIWPRVAPKLMGSRTGGRAAG
jgi:hypothetical protein